MIAWENYRTILAPAGVVSPEPDWYVDQYVTDPPYKPPGDPYVVGLPRVVNGSNNVPATGLLVYVGAQAVDGTVLEPSGSLTLQILEIVPGPNGPTLFEVEAALAVDLGVPTDLGVVATGDYVVRAVSSTGVSADAVALYLLRKVV